MTSSLFTSGFVLISEVLGRLGLRVLPISNNLIGNGDVRQKFVPRGLVNIGNTCFMNSILQAMSSSPSFLAHLVSLKKYSRADSFAVILLNGLNELRDRTVSGPHSATFPRLMKMKLEEFRGIFKGNDENDAQELFTAVLELLEKDRQRVEAKHFKDSLRSLRPQLRPKFVKSGDGKSEIVLNQSRSRPVNPCEGLYAMHMKCIRCSKATSHTGWKAVKLEPFTALPLDIPTPTTIKKQFPLSDSIDANSPAGVSRLFGGGMKGSLSRMSMPPSVLKKSDVSLESCLDLFLESEERTDINCESCTLHNVAASFNSSKAKSNGDTSKKVTSSGSSSEYHLITSSEESSPTGKEVESDVAAVGSVVLRSMSQHDCYLVDVDNEEVEEKVASINGHLWNMIYGKNRLQYLLKQTMIQSTSIAMFPPLLCFHLKRIFMDNYGNLKKVQTKVTFPVVLDVNKYVKVPESNGRIGRTSRSDTECSSGSGDSDATSVCSKSDYKIPPVGVRSRIADYLLRAVVVHCGSPTSGHYVAYCLVEDSPKRVWAYFSDDQVCYVEESRVLASEAYMLFYDRAVTSVNLLQHN